MMKMNEYDYNKMLEELELNDIRDKSKREKVNYIINKNFSILKKITNINFGDLNNFYEFS